MIPRGEIIPGDDTIRCAPRDVRTYLARHVFDRRVALVRLLEEMFLRRSLRIYNWGLLSERKKSSTLK